MQIIKRDALPQIGKAKDLFAIGSLPEFAVLADNVNEDDRRRHRVTTSNRWTGGKDYDTSVKQCRIGDLSGVEPSDKILSKLEIAFPVTAKFAIVNDVCGGVPNVPAMLAGHPLSMRRRQRLASEQAPLCIFVSLELSAGIDIGTMRQRGATILALVRLLSDKRPIDLYACCSVGQDGLAAHIITRIDTAPLDLARAAHFLTCPSVTRGLNYAACDSLMVKHFGKVWSGHWAYGDHGKYIKHAREIFLSAVNPSAEALLIPAAELNDPCVKTPELWIKKMLETYGGLPVEE